MTESLRYETAAQYLMRRVLKDTEVAGRRLPTGIPIVVLVAAANRDPEVFERPDTFDVRRKNLGDVIDFGTGIHCCPGSALTRHQTQIALRLLFERFPRIRLAGTPKRRCSTGQRGIGYLPVRLVSMTRPLEGLGV
ncbi:MULTISPECIES: cytochrome P450 [unclassified Streptomyces]|uniref:cytochrome P450 n=1 Tax=unclassified Streptomyces TaxID=2593676 RepID=UPI0023650041|nr:MULTISPECIES: cytochrome P450 [unclassified Streptomyces]MDF3139931.1 cytochrome P450 [Streptomyces sp. T21Q-yed]WDF44017.1 cytochrome P450 [Streptomyces sp. T12]